MDNLVEFSGPFVEGFALGLLLFFLTKGGEKSYVVGNFRKNSKLLPLGWFEMPTLVTAFFAIVWLALVALGFLLPWSHSKMDRLMLFLGAGPGTILALGIWHFYLRGR